MDKWSNREINSKEVASLYNEKRGEWLLLEVLKTGKNNRAELFRLLNHAKDKEILHEYLLEDENRDWSKKYIFVFADPEKLCDITDLIN